MDSTVVFRVLFILIALGFAALWTRHLVSIGVTSERAYTSEEGLVVAVPRALCLAASVLGMVLFSIDPRLMAWARLVLPDWLRWLGVFVALSALVLFARVLRALGHNFSTSLTLRADQTLVVIGPYRWVRHPMYVAFIGLWSGYLLLAANWFIGATGLCAFGWVLLLRTPKEEQLMLRRFGADYASYMDRTGRYLPRWKAIRSWA